MARKMGSPRRGGRLEKQSLQFRTHAIERLDPRSMLAADIALDLSAGVLRIDGTDGPDSVLVQERGSIISVSWNTSTGTTSRTWQSSEIRSILFNGYAGDDQFTNNTRINCVANGGAGNDSLFGGAGNDILNGNDGNDNIRGNSGDDQLDGGAGNDTLEGGKGEDKLFGSYGNDGLWGQEANDQLYGGDGNDWLEGGAQNDIVFGDNDQDQVYGNDGDDFMQGGPGHDNLWGGNGNDQINGNDGDDNLDGQSGSDRLQGGNGKDRSWDSDRFLEDSEQNDHDYRFRYSGSSNGAISNSSTVQFDSSGNAILSGSLGAGEAKRFFTFIAPKSGTLNIAMSTANIAQCPELTIFNSSTRKELLELDPKKSGGTSRALSLVAGQSYSIQLEGLKNQSSTFNVNLSIR